MALELFAAMLPPLASHIFSQRQWGWIELFWQVVYVILVIRGSSVFRSILFIYDKLTPINDTVLVLQHIQLEKRINQLAKFYA